MKARRILGLTGLTLGAALGLQTLWPQPAAAGVVVLKNGEVLVGRIRDDEITKDQITVRWPYKDKLEKGEIDLPRFRVRWFDPKADEPTDEYWEKFGDKNIDDHWLPLYEKWKLRKKAREESLEGDFLLTAENFMSKASLSALPIENGDFKIQYPEGWTSSLSDGITIFESNQPGTDGFKARIHVFAVKAAIGQTEDQVRWVEEAVARLAAGEGKFEVKERKRPRPKGGGFDQELLTQTGRNELKVVALRMILLRKKNTYFFTAYSHERDYSSLEFLFKACMRSLELKEDERAARKATAGGGGGGAPTGGAQPASGGAPPQDG